MNSRECMILAGHMIRGFGIKIANRQRRWDLPMNLIVDNAEAIICWTSSRVIGGGEGAA